MNLLSLLQVISERTYRTIVLDENNNVLLIRPRLNLGLFLPYKQYKVIRFAFSNEVITINVDTKQNDGMNISKVSFKDIINVIDDKTDVVVKSIALKHLDNIVDRIFFPFPTCMMLEGVDIGFNEVNTYYFNESNGIYSSQNE